MSPINRRKLLQIASLATAASTVGMLSAAVSAAPSPATAQADIVPKMHVVDEGRGFPVLLGHSYLWDSKMWQPQRDALRAHFRLITPDLWGHGRSPAMPAGTGDLRALARQHLDLLDALQIERCHVVGLSVGGMWAAELALMAPDRVEQLILMDTYLGAEPADKQAYYFDLIDQLEVLGRFDPALIKQVAPLFFHPNGTTVPALRQAFEAALAGFESLPLRGSILPLGRLIFGRDDRLAALGQLDAERTLVMCGAHDIPRPPVEARHMAELIGCDFIAIPEAGHIANLENPDFVTQVLLQRLLG